MKTPAIIINMKTYSEATGKHGMNLAELCQDSYDGGNPIAIAPQQCDLALYAHKFKMPILAQHADNVKQGSTTGRITPEAIKHIGCAGTLINHSEYRISPQDVEALVGRCRSLGLTTVVCTKDAAESQAYSRFRPDFIAVEPPELIGGVTTVNPQIVADSVRLVKSIEKDVKVLCGAGVKNGKDVAKAIELGADGVLLASGVVKAKDRKAVLDDLVSGL